jgi:hypothetical protein
MHAIFASPAIWHRGHLINSRQTTWNKLVRAGLAARSNRQLFRRRLTKLQRIINRVAKA